MDFGPRVLRCSGPGFVVHDASRCGLSFDVVDWIHHYGLDFLGLGEVHSLVAMWRMREAWKALPATNAKATGPSSKMLHALISLLKLCLDVMQMLHA